MRLSVLFRCLETPVISASSQRQFRGRRSPAEISPPTKYRPVWLHPSFLNEKWGSARSSSLPPVFRLLLPRLQLQPDIEKGPPRPVPSRRAGHRIITCLAASQAPSLHLLPRALPAMRGSPPVSLSQPHHPFHSPPAGMSSALPLPAVQDHSPSLPSAVLLLVCCFPLVRRYILTAAQHLPTSQALACRHFLLLSAACLHSPF